MLEAIFFLALFGLMYTFIGYPVLLTLWPKRRAAPLQRADHQPQVAIVIVVHNGAALIRQKVASCLAQNYPPERLRVVIVSDGSSDGIERMVDAIGDSRVRLLSFPHRRGKAACLNDVVPSCSEEVLVLTDARQRLHPDAVRHLVANLADQELGAASGQLVFERDGITGYGEGLDAYWRYEKMLRRMESSIHSTVGVTGALYAIRRECFRTIPDETILDDVLIPMNVVLQGRRVVFENAAIAYDRPSRDARQERVRKIRTLAGNFQLLGFCPALLSPWHNPIALQFISHKVMRLVAPLCMAMALGTNVLLLDRGIVFAAMLLLQLGAYFLAALGFIWPRSRALSLVRLPMTLVSLNWFVVLGFFEFISNPNAHLWAGQQAVSRDSSSAS